MFQRFSSGLDFPVGLNIQAFERFLYVSCLEGFYTLTY